MSSILDRSQPLPGAPCRQVGPFFPSYTEAGCQSPNGSSELTWTALEKGRGEARGSGTQPAAHPEQKQGAAVFGLGCGGQHLSLLRPTRGRGQNPTSHLLSGPPSPSPSRARGEESTGWCANQKGGSAWQAVAPWKSGAALRPQRGLGGGDEGSAGTGVTYALSVGSSLPRPLWGEELEGRKGWGRGGLRSPESENRALGRKEMPGTCWAQLDTLAGAPWLARRSLASTRVCLEPWPGADKVSGGTCGSPCAKAHTGLPCQDA